MVYLHDGLDIENLFERADFASHHIKGDLYASGFVINEAKSHWIPVQKIDWLGITWDFDHGVISINKAEFSRHPLLLTTFYPNPPFLQDCCLLLSVQLCLLVLL